MRWNYLSIPKLQRCNRWSFGMDKSFHPTVYIVCDYFSMLGLKLNHVCKRGHWKNVFKRFLGCLFCPGLNMLTHHIRLGQHWFRQWLVAWQHQATPWTKANFITVRSCGIHQSAQIPSFTVRARLLFCTGGYELTHWGLDKMDSISQTTFSSAVSRMKMYEFRLKFHWSLFLRVQLTKFQHWFR